MGYRRILRPTDIDDPCDCKKGPSKCLRSCDFFPPGYYVVPPPPISKPDHHSGLSSTLIIIIIVLCSVFLVLTCYAIVTQFCIGWRTRAPSIRRGGAEEEDEEEEEGGEAMDPPVNYVWYINTVGLQQSVINAITICKYKEGDGLIEGTECSVCLSEFRDDEDVRLLPKCSHAFHVNCIDTWLRSHVNCPLCRAHIVSNPAISSAANLQVPDDNPVGFPHENAQSLPGLDMHADGQNLGEESISEDERVDGRMMDVETLNGESSCGIKAISDLAGNHAEDEYILEIGPGEELQPVRRSVSMDSSAASKIYSSFVAARQAKHDGDTKKGSHARAKGSSLLNRPVAMKRSFSSSGNFFPKRHRRNRSSVLPSRWQ